MTFRLATPAELARMSWHAREKYHTRRRAYAKQLEAERPPERTPDRLKPEVSVPIRETIRAIDEALTWAAENGLHLTGRRGEWTRPEPADETYLDDVVARLGAGQSPAEIAAQRGVRPQSIARYARRYARYDLAHIFDDRAKVSRYIRRAA